MQGQILISHGISLYKWLGAALCLHTTTHGLIILWDRGRKRKTYRKYQRHSSNLINFWAILLLLLSIHTGQVRQSVGCSNCCMNMVMWLDFRHSPVECSVKEISMHFQESISAMHHFPVMDYKLLSFDTERLLV